MTDLLAQTRADHDAMGHELLAGLEDEEVFEIIEREDGYIGGMATSGYFAGFDQRQPWEQEAIGCLVPGRVLDLGCGRVELYLQTNKKIRENS